MLAQKLKPIAQKNAHFSELTVLSDISGMFVFRFGKEVNTSFVAYHQTGESMERIKTAISDAKQIYKNFPIIICCDFNCPEEEQLGLFGLGIHGLHLLKPDSDLSAESLFEKSKNTAIRYSKGVQVPAFKNQSQLSVVYNGSSVVLCRRTHTIAYNGRTTTPTLHPFNTALKLFEREGGILKHDEISDRFGNSSGRTYARDHMKMVRGTFIEAGLGDDFLVTVTGVGYKLNI